MFGFLMALSAAASLAGGFAQYNAQRAAGKAAQQAAEYEATLAGRRAEQLDIRAGQERASSQRTAMEQRRQGRFVESRARALAAASGGGVSDPTVTNIMGDINTEAEYRALTARYQGEELARGLEYGAVLERAGAEGTRYAGEVERSLSKSRASQALLSGVGGAATAGAQYYYATEGSGPQTPSEPETIAGGPTPLYKKYAASYTNGAVPRASWEAYY